MTLREALAFVCEREVARRDERRVEMAVKIALPFVRDLQGFDFAAQPSLDPKQVRELATGRFVAEAVLLLGPPGRQDASRRGARPRGDPPGLLGPVRHRPGPRRRARQGARGRPAGGAALLLRQAQLLIVDERLPAF